MQIARVHWPEDNPQRKQTIIIDPFYGFSPPDRENTKKRSTIEVVQNSMFEDEINPVGIPCRVRKTVLIVTNIDRLYRFLCTQTWAFLVGAARKQIRRIDRLTVID